MIGRRIKNLQWSVWLGDMSIITNYILKKPWLSPWCLPKTINAILRSIGTVAFANNPITGFLVLTALFLEDVFIGLACLLAGVTGIIFSKILRLPEKYICEGVTFFNMVLLGCISVSTYPSVTGKPIDGAFWGYLTFLLAATAYIDVGLQNILASMRLPVLSIPFNLAITLMLLGVRDVAETSSGVDTSLLASNSTQEIEWTRVMEGTLMASGQIYGVHTILSSSLIYLGYFIYSPLLTSFLYLGSVIGTFMGTLLSSPPYSDVYSGVWGYNSLLTSGGLVFFLHPSPSGTLAALIGAALTAVIQAAVLNAFAPTTVPVFSYPFLLALLPILAISGTPDSPLKRVTKFSYPEKHLLQHFRGLEKKEKQESKPDISESQTIFI